MASNIKIFVDSGAFTQFGKHQRKRAPCTSLEDLKRRVNSIDSSFTQTPEYKKYRREYAKFIRADRKLIDVFANLDVIFDAEQTYKNQKWLEARGLDPLPVWHPGCDTRYLQRYLDEGYKYICIGGMTAISKDIAKSTLDSVWRKFLTDDKGMPLVKVHGFAMTGFDLMYRYPWYSVDSKSWIDSASYGKILFPRSKGYKKWDYKHPTPITISDRVMQIKGRDPGRNFYSMTKQKRKLILDWLASIPAIMGKSKYRKEMFGYKPKKDQNERWAKRPTENDKTGLLETVIERGVCNDFHARADINMFVFRKIEGEIPKWPWSITNTIGLQRRGLLNLS